jgi:hypothetical protein
MRIVLAGMAAASLLSACTTVPPEANAAETAAPAAPAASADACNAAPVQALVGRQRSEAVAGEALRGSGARALRWLEPGSMYTMDYREDRLNISVDARGRITALRCG